LVRRSEPSKIALIVMESPQRSIAFFEA